MKKKLLCLALASAISLAAQAADKVKVGFVSTLSGPGGVLGVAIRDGFQLGIEHAGGKLGGLPVEVLIEDDQQKPDVAKQLAEKLIKRDKVDFMTGIVFQNILQAAQATVLGAETYYVSPNTGPSDLAGAGCNPYFFAVSWVSDSYSEATGKNMTDKGYKNVFVIAPNYPGGKDVVNGFKRYYKGNYAGEAYTKLGQLDYAVEISQMRAAKPDAVFFFLPGGMGVNFLKQWQQAGMNKDFPLFGTGWSFDQDTLAAVGEPTLGALNTSHWNLDLDNAANKKFVADFEKKYGRLPNEFAAQGYDAALLLDAAVRDVKGKIEDKAALRKALEAASFKSVRGAFKFNKNHFPIQNYYLRQVVKDDKGRFVNKTAGTVFTDHQDAYVSACNM
ncbi:MAG: ABC transporter substrate-binding protein [Rhodocyclaceae bacterium]|nr:ABC transporter substrate-binding protein [Rhodocyclaceae bacterium]MBK6554638.1 ABC transporter substrate-binding protein [Rhodocyclaceae bacterium]MBK6677427.1 ABC transporter substrate-binding protein [Rhodocyclaceae bacterium]MBK9310083.1 ABC transporter substrate-binding protein [Rhodocyclaceae bacterium]